MATLKYLADIDLNKNALNNAVIQNLSTAPSNPAEGQVYYDTGTDDLNIYNGSAWIRLGQQGDITSVVAGAGTTGGGTSGDVTLNVIGGNGITANANDVAITASQTTVTSLKNAGLTVGRDAHNLIDFSTDNEIKFKTNNETPVIIMKASGEIEATKFNGALEGNADTATLATNAQGIAGATDGDVNILSDGNVKVKLDSDNDESNQKLSVTNNADTEVFSVSETGNVGLSGTLGVGSRITNTNTNSDLGIDSDGSISFKIDADNDETSQKFSFLNYTTEIAVLAENGDLQIDGNLTPAGIILDGNTITGVDDSGEFTDDDAHIMTSAGINDRFAQINANTTGNADTATILATARAINGVNFDGSAAITVTAAAGTLSGNTLKSTVVASSLTSVGTIATGVWNGTAIASANLDADTAHLTTAQTFTGSKTMGTNVKLNFRDANSYINSPKSANDIEVVATTITLDAANDIQLEGNTTVTGDLSISGTLNVDGTTTTIDSTTVAIADSMLKLAKDQANNADVVDFGFYGQYGVSGTHKYAGIYRDVSVGGDPFVFFDNLTVEPGTTVSTAGAHGFDFADIRAGSITALDGFTGDITGDVTGNADTVTTNANLTGHITSSGNAAVLGSFTVAQLSSALSNASISGNNTGDQSKSDIDGLAITTVGTLDNW